jgi:hypothetical protein
MFYDDIFFADFKGYVELEHGVAHVQRESPLIEVILRVGFLLLAFLGVAAYVGRIVPASRVWKGAAASMCVALITLAAISIYEARSGGLDYFLSAKTIVVWIVVSLSLGAATAWVSAVWWPNKSLERTRER